MAYGNTKVVVDVKEVVQGEILYTNADGKEQTYYPTHSIWLEVQTLEVLTILGDPEEEGAQPPLVIRVNGTATLEDYSICVVGDPGSEVRTLSISFFARDWRPKREELKPGIFPSLDSKLGDAMLGFSRADWEIGNSDDWWIACYLPKSFIDALVVDVRSGQIHGMKLGLSLRDLYTNVHSLAPVSARGNLFLRPNKRDNTIEMPEMATGYVRSIHFASANLNLQKPQPPEHEDTFATEDEAQATSQEHPVALSVTILGAHVEQMRRTLRWVGSLIVAVLLLVALK